MHTINSNIHILEPLYVRIKNYPRSFQAKAINYCYVYKEENKKYTIFSQYLKDDKKETKQIIDVIGNSKIELDIDIDFILDVKKKPEKVDPNSIYIICETNDGTIAVPREFVSKIQFNSIEEE
ncbi:hypothetical protein M9Y10_011250 [Tritrichomonas musculus]|uniref:Uncharacterized protein n=1 Tax=Tritrichomonas musculus TaxID=1915356 RepID=A0ABR2IIZ3_9EUKA